MNKNAIIAVFKRNLASYFGSPSGYVFICAFLLASGLAAFWPQEFFDSNLANLDQLNKFLPHILLGFIPAITMSVWADERRQGTDELLLTLPGSDFDVVLGKYFGAVAIFTASIVISLLANYYVLGQLGNPDFGLLFSTYVGYWFVGLSMLAIGMVASFLTANLTVAFVLGVAFNAPIALLSDSAWGISYNFLDFSRGIISISG
ncbi:MAG: ABC transporter permease, partial [Rhodobacterales bacterium]|nr:ABC transporter permease [Rhodobacterales bacterium]